MRQEPPEVQAVLANAASPDVRFVPVEGDPISKRFLGIGCPKSGTTYLAWLMRELGIQVEHERMGHDGTVNSAWLFPRLVDDQLLEGPHGRQHFVFDRVIHIVRRPEYVIASLRALPPWPFLRWQYLWTGIRFDPQQIPSVDDLAELWIFWTDRCSSAADFTIRLDDIANIGPPRNETVTEVESVKLTDIQDPKTRQRVMSRMIHYWGEIS